MRKIAPRAFLIALIPLLAFGQVPTTGLMVGPDAPIIVDQDGDGRPEPSDIQIVPTIDDDEVTIPNPWEGCGPGQHNVIVMDPPGGPYDTAIRSHDTESQLVTADQFDGARPTHFQASVDQASGPDHSGSGGVIDTDSDSIYDALEGSGSNGLDFLLDFVYADVTGDGFGDYVSVPWAQASALSAATGDNDTCDVGTSGDPQIFVPLADTNGDGRPDSIVIDLDGDGIPDPEFRPGPIMGPAVIAFVANPVPTLSQWGMILAMAAIAAVAWVQIRSNNLGA